MTDVLLGREGFFDLYCIRFEQDNDTLKFTDETKVVLFFASAFGAGLNGGLSSHGQSVVPHFRGSRMSAIGKSGHSAVVIAVAIDPERKSRKAICFLTYFRPSCVIT